MNWKSWPYWAVGKSKFKNQNAKLQFKIENL